MESQPSAALRAIHATVGLEVSHFHLLLPAPWQLWTRESPPRGLLKEDPQKGRSPPTLWGRNCYRRSATLMRRALKDVQTTTRGRLDQAYENSVVHRRHLVASPDNI